MKASDRLDEAIELLQTRPDHANTLMNYAIVNLLEGNFPFCSIFGE